MNDMLNGDVAVITGGAHHFGKVLALGLAQAGARVVVADLDARGAEATAQLIRSLGGVAMSVGVDVTAPASCAAMAARVEATFGPVSVLVNNAGERVGGAGDVDQMDNLRKTYALHIDGTLGMVTALLPQLRRTGARIVNICSSASRMAAPGATLYGSGKAALVQLTRELAAELGADKIRVNGVALDAGGAPKDVVSPVVFLASTGSHRVSGTVVSVDAGQPVYMPPMQMYLVVR